MIIMSTYSDPASMSTTTSTIDISTIDIGSFTLPSYTFYSGTTASSYGNVTINSGAMGATGSSMYTTGGLNGTSWNNSSVSSGLHVTSDAEFEGDIKWKGRSLGKLLEKIEDRLAILQEPNPAKLEKYAALKKAYDHYKTMERLIGED